MQEPTLLLLTALADEPRHGYATAREAARRLGVSGDATEGAGRLTRLREGCDVVGQALRLRLRVALWRRGYSGRTGHA